MSLFEPELEYPVLTHDVATGKPSEKLERGYQVGLIAVRDARGIAERVGTTSRVVNGFGVDHVPGKMAIVHTRTHRGALFLADTLSLTASESDTTAEDLHRWLRPYLAWVQAVCRAESLDLPLPTYRDFIANQNQERAA